MKNWVTPRQYAVLSGQSLATVKLHLSMGKIKGILVNNKWRIYPDELESLLGVTHPNKLKED